MTRFLFDIIRKEIPRLRKAGPATKAGFQFENLVTDKILEHFARRRYGEKVYPPRCKLSYPSFSGVKHQFDVTVEHNKTFYLIECKRRKASAKDQILAFTAKILDYALGFKAHGLDYQIKGIFLSTAEISEGARAYALSFGVIPIDPVLPPVDYLMKKVGKKDVLTRQLDKLRRKLSYTLPDLLDLNPDERDPQVILKFYKQIYTIWRGKGYEYRKHSKSS